MKNAAELLGITVTTLRSYLNNNLSYNEYIISDNSFQDNEVKEFSSKPQSIMLTNIKDSSIIKEELCYRRQQPPTIKDAAEFLSITRSSLSYIFNSSQNVQGGFSTINGYIISRREKSLNYIKPNSKSIEVTDLENNTTNIYPSVTLAADALGVTKGSI